MRLQTLSQNKAQTAMVSLALGGRKARPYSPGARVGRQSRLSAQIKEVFVFTLSVLLLTSVAPAAVKAHAGHGDEFHSSSEATTPEGIAVDAQTAKRMGIEVQPVTKQQLDVGIKTTGAIETLPSQNVEVTAPVAGKLLQLLVEPGDAVKKNQPVAILSSHDLVNLRVESLAKRAEAEADRKEAEANLKLAKENLDRQGKIASAEIEQAQTQLAAARAQYERDKALVDERAVLAVAKENYQRHVEIAEAEIARAETELAVAREQYERDKELAESGAVPRRQMLESQAHLAEAQAAVARAKSRPDVLQAETEVKRAEVELPVRELRESQAKLAEAQAQLTKANQRRDVLEAEAEVKRATAAVEVALSRLQLSDTAYQTRLKQLGTPASEDGTVTVTAPIAGRVAHRDITPGESVDAAGKPLMRILDDTRVWASANIYEKDLSEVAIGQAVRVRVASLPERTFTGRIAVIGAVVDGETRVVPVRAELENAGGQLKPGMFAELEVITDKTPAAVVAIPAAAVVEANGKPLVYAQNGQNFEPVEVTLGQTAGDTVEVKNGLFEGDRIVTQGAIQLYAQSLRGGSKKAGEPASKGAKEPVSKGAKENFSAFTFNPSSLPWWWAIPAGGAIAAGAFWAGRRSKPAAVETVYLASVQSVSETGSGERQLPASYTGEFCELPVLAENNHHHSSVAGKD